MNWYKPDRDEVYCKDCKFCDHNGKGYECNYPKNLQNYHPSQKNRYNNCGWYTEKK